MGRGFTGRLKKKIIMTKKEAFDYLKGTKVVLQTEDEQVKLQEFLFSIGYKWQTIECTSVMRLYDDDCMFFIGIDGHISHNGYKDSDDRVFCDTHIYTKMRVEDILGIKIDEEKGFGERFRSIQDTLKDKQIMVISKDNVMIIDL